MLSRVRGSLCAAGLCAIAIWFLMPATHPQLLTSSSSLSAPAGLSVLAESATDEATASPDRQTAVAPPVATARTISCELLGPDGYQQCRFTDELAQTMTFLLHVPTSGDPTRKYPLALVLHGGGERCQADTTFAEARSTLDAAAYVKVWSTDVATRGVPAVQSRWPSYVVVPQLVLPKRWVDVAPGQGPYDLLPEPTAELRLAREILDQLQVDHSDIDASRIYATGISLGGYGTWDAIERWPDYFAAAAPVSGGGDPSKAGELKDLPIWAFHGSDDPTVPVSGSRAMVRAIQAAGGQPKYTEYAGAGHDIFATVYDPVGQSGGQSLFEWLFAQQKPGGEDQP